MRWKGNKRSNNVQDQRNVQFRGGGSGGGTILRLLPTVLRFLGFKGTAILAAGAFGLAAVTGNVGTLLGVLGLQQSTAPTQISKPLQQSTSEKELVNFVSVILADTEQTWHTLFKQKGKTYKEPKLVLFRDRVKSACGMAESATGPFYCPGDQKIYIDLDFYDQLKNRFNAPGDFAQAYVLAHEVGHHIQTLLGISKKVHQARSSLSKVEGNKLSVRQELQADCLAGVWANNANKHRQLLEVGDLEEGLTAATAIGDDTLQRQSGGQVVPDSFTHGSSKQRVKWFKIGFVSGNMDSCDTFTKFDTKAPSLLKASKAQAVNGNSQILRAFKNKLKDVQVKGYGIVERILPDDNEGSRHQKFILKINNNLSVLVAHNIDEAKRIPRLKVGETIEFNGEYIWKSLGGVLHWTHKANRSNHIDGWLKYRGQLYW